MVHSFLRCLCRDRRKAEVWKLPLLFFFFWQSLSKYVHVFVRLRCNPLNAPGHLFERYQVGEPFDVFCQQLRKKLALRHSWLTGRGTLTRIWSFSLLRVYRKPIKRHLYTPTPTLWKSFPASPFKQSLTQYKYYTILQTINNKKKGCCSLFQSL